MSSEAIRLLKDMDQEDINTQIALQCAPLLCNIKISNMLITNNRNSRKVEQIFKKSLFSYKMIYKNNNRVIFLVYQKDKLEKYISQVEIVELLSLLGYINIDLEFTLEEFKRRFLSYMNGKKDFPHEIGLLLGYPIEDVKGFIENKGQNSIYIGYWKVYKNLQKAKSTFESFNEAKEMLIHMMAHGFNIKNIIDLYNSNSRKKLLYYNV